MRTSYSLGIGFVAGIRVTALPQDIPFVATPDRLRELVKPEASKVEMTKVARQEKSSRRTEHRGAQRKETDKHGRPLGITTRAAGDKSARALRRQL